MITTDYSRLSEPQREALLKISREAVMVQDAVNLLGVLKSFEQASKILFEISLTLGLGTAWINTHSVMVLFSSKVASLTGSEDFDRVSAAFEEAKELTETLAK